MKILTLIVHTNVQQVLVDQLSSLEQVSGFTFSQAEGHGTEIESDAFLFARDKVVGYTPRLRVEILLEDKNVEAVLAMLRRQEHEIAGQGVYWISPVENGGHL